MKFHGSGGLNLNKSQENLNYTANCLNAVVYTLVWPYFIFPKMRTLGLIRKHFQGCPLWPTGSLTILTHRNTYASYALLALWQPLNSRDDEHSNPPGVCSICELSRTSQSWSGRVLQSTNLCLVNVASFSWNIKYKWYAIFFKPAVHL